MTEPRQAAAIVGLILLGWAMVALAAALRSWWPLFLATLPYAAVPWIIVRAERGAR